MWSLFADLLTLLESLNTRSVVTLLPNKFEGCGAVQLPEDAMLAGFLPLLCAPHIQNYCQTPFDKEKARTCFRISRIQFFGEYLCGIPERYLAFDVGNRCYRSLVVVPPAAPDRGAEAAAKREVIDEVSHSYARA